uniref:MYM-type domain-containing protein n=1 Tax=viral metagenome TaxID=1070528 RepID=A0A6C0ER52_9ZZZZ
MENIDETTVLKKKRGRRKKVVENDSIEPPQNIELVIIEPIGSQPATEQSHVAKKRGRKPKGGKLILKQCEPNLQKNIITNVILHLKCSMCDLNEYTDKINKLVTDPLSYNPSVPPDIMTYDDSQYTGLKYEKIDSIIHDNSIEKHANISNYAYINEVNGLCNLCNNCKQINESTIVNDDDEDSDEINMKDINSKLKRLKLHLYKNSMPDKKSACFWCTCEFDNPSCYIPKYEMDEDIHGYGSFCRPECATAYLMKENIDDSTKFERYHLLNKIYSKIYDYKKNIKPAPNPYYLLDKFYGNLSIQEYRKLLKTEHMLLVIEKPMTRILPELHEDNEEIVLNVYGGNNKTQNTSGVYKVKRESEKQKGPSKTSIMRNKFGLGK